MSPYSDYNGKRRDKTDREPTESIWGINGWLSHSHLILRMSVRLKDIFGDYPITKDV